MLVDGITLMDDTSVKSKQIENSGNAFPANPIMGQLWGLTEKVGEYIVGDYVYAGADWFLIKGQSSKAHDIGLSVFGEIPSSRDVCRYLCNRTMVLPARLEDTIAASMGLGSGTSRLEIKIVRFDETITPLGFIDFESGKSSAVLSETPNEETYISVGDIISISSVSIAVGLTDLCVTIAGQLIL